MVKIITQNVRGMRDRVKRRAIFLHLRKKAKIICLQETHSSPEDVQFWESEWGGPCYWSHGTTDSKGCAVLIDRDADFKVNNCISDSDGRYVLLQYSLYEQNFTLINVYAPNEDNPEFWLNIFRLFEEYEGNRILVGDFNVALNPEIDRSNNKARNNDRSKEIINNYCEDSYLMDVWRDRNPELKTYTFIRNKPSFIGSRLDYILVDSRIISWTKDVRIVPGFRSDHSAVIIDLQPLTVKSGKGFWRLNTRLLFEIDYVTKIQQTIEQISEAGEESDKRDLWEMIKLHVIAESQAYSNERA